MKKENFYRTCKQKGKYFFYPCEGYLYTIVTPLGSVDLAISKCGAGCWDITHLQSGGLACIRTYSTMREAVAQLDDENYINALLRVLDMESCKESTKQLQRFTEKKAKMNANI